MGAMGRVVIAVISWGMGLTWLLCSCRGGPWASGDQPAPARAANSIIQGWESVAAEAHLPRRVVEGVSFLLDEGIRSHGIADAPDRRERYEASLRRLIAQHRFALVEPDYAYGFAFWLAYCVLSAFERADPPPNVGAILASLDRAVEQVEACVVSTWTAALADPGEDVRQSIARRAKQFGEALRRRTRALHEDFLCPAFKSSFDDAARDDLLARYREKAIYPSLDGPNGPIPPESWIQSRILKFFEQEEGVGAARLFFFSVKAPLNHNPYWGLMRHSCRSQDGDWPLWVSMAPARDPRGIAAESKRARGR
jgi:hypothetical protein